MLDELKFRYRALSVSVRILICLTLGSLPGLMSYFEEAIALEADLENANLREVDERNRLAAAKDKIKNIAQVEEKLNFTRDQLKKAETKLPNSVLVDEVINQIGKASNSTGVTLKSFIPNGSDVIQGEYPYDEVKFEVILNGPFSGLAHWLDVMSSQESRAYAKGWRLEKVVASRSGGKAEGIPIAASPSPDMSNQSKSPSNDAAMTANKDATPLEVAEKAREDFRLDFLVNLSYFRSSSSLPVAANANIPTAKGEKSLNVDAGSHSDKAGVEASPPEGEAPKVEEAEVAK